MNQSNEDDNQTSKIVIESVDLSRITPQMNINARNGDLEACRKLINEGVDVNCEVSILL